jgi:hypothetical protein
MRVKAKGNGALESNAQQKVETTVVEKDTVIIVQSTSPEIIYVPSYSPTVVYGPPPPYYPYPPIYYPPYPPGAAFVSFSFGFMMGAAIWGGSCCHAGWGGNTVIINNNNNFNQINHNRGGAGSGNWQHNPTHRGGAPYGDRATTNKYGGSSRGQGAGGQARPSTQPSIGGQPRAGVSDRAAGGAGGAGGRAGGDQIGSRNIPSSSVKPSAMSGGSRGFSGTSARATSSRGASSMGGRGGGGGRRR